MPPSCRACASSRRSFRPWGRPDAPPQVIARVRDRIRHLPAAGIAGAYRLMQCGAAVAAAILICCTAALLYQSAAPPPAAPVWEEQAAYGAGADLASGGSEEVLASWTLHDLSGSGDHE